MAKDVFECMKDSQSIRHFKSEPIPESVLARILEAACWAPSAGNLQPWYFYVVKNQQLKDKIFEVSFEQEQIKQAPVLIVVLSDPARSNERYHERGAQLYCLQDTAAATQNMLLAAEALDIGSCWIGAFDEVKVQTLLEAPPRLRAVAMLAIGYSDEKERQTKERLRVAEVAKIIE
ncbi:MAG: nitroreductase [Anaerosporomusa subterranea]|jgi:nitroreductase|nr:nitroreductase [Anaerosporomusa subterranea]